MVGTGRFEIALSVPVVFEYEEVAKRQIDELVYTDEEVDGIIGYLCEVADQTAIYFLWRKYSRDPKDEKILELAVAAGCDTIVTFNRRNFTQAKMFGIQVLTPRQFLGEIGELP